MPEFNFLKGHRSASSKTPNDKKEELHEPASLQCATQEGNATTPTPAFEPGSDASKTGTANQAQSTPRMTGHTSAYTIRTAPPNADEGKPRTMRRTSARPNAVAIPALILLLLAASLFFILRLDGSGFFRKSFPIQSKGRASGSPTNAPLTKQGARGLKAVPTTADSVRDWNYYLQVSSWKKLTDAERVAQEYRDKGVTVKVQCVYLQTKRATVYRVRCGPFPSKSSASTFRETNASILPTDAFVDSIRAEQDPSGVKTVPTLTIPCRGYGIPVSSFDQSFSAKKRALEIAEQYAVPVFINVQQIHLTTWYRVFVGPFLTRSDAQRQAQFLSLFMKNDMQEFDLSKEK